MTIGERIKERRMELGLSVDEVADWLGKNRATVYRYESGYIEDMPSSVLEALAVVLMTTPADLLGWDDLPEAGTVLEVSQVIKSTLTDAEAELVRKYRRLNVSDKARIEERMDEMLEKSESSDETKIS